ncbi:MAG TPA: hypothetical protein VGH54_19845 [Mycobacterium sp.]|jgi:hypothetical protein|uniref:hypothetical protein n=1 Tax=Mycobacterium sp. TaxID=1785 RepID=UPI002F3F3397
MPEWHCRLAAASPVPERCQGPRHGKCGLRYLPGEYTVTGNGIMLPGIGTVRMEGAAFAPKDAPVIVYQDDDGWTAEFA